MSWSVTDVNSPGMKCGPFGWVISGRGWLVVFFTRRYTLLRFTGKLLPARFVMKTRKDTVHTLKACLYFPYLLCIVTSIKSSPILYLVWCCPKVLCFLDICIRLLANHEAIWLSRKMLTLGLGEVPKHCSHNSYNKPMNQTLLKNNCQDVIVCEGTFPQP